ncbi:MAG: hypothetical protein QOH62_765 [Solirubrobacteraceae bacterium]|nr:hypothetical protein [Solirubrobacteraceae bacterium]
MTATELDRWLPNPTVRIAHRREARASAARLWSAAQSIRLRDTRALGSLVRWRIPGLPADPTYDELFRSAPFTPLHETQHALVSGLCGRIWTLRRDYPRLAGPDEFLGWSAPGTARVLFAHWVEPAGDGRSALVSETRVAPVGRQGRIGLLAVRPLIVASQNLIGSEPLTLAVRRAEGSDRKR